MENIEYIYIYMYLIGFINGEFIHNIYIVYRVHIMDIHLRQAGKSDIGFRESGVSLGIIETQL